MLCPNCGTVVEKYATTCNFCGYDLSKDYNSLDKVNKEPETPANPTMSPSEYTTKEKTDSVRWVGPRRTFHICSILSGISAILFGYSFYLATGLINFFTPANGGMEAGVWCILFGIILIVLGIVGLVKIHSPICCLVLSILHVVSVLPFWNYKYLLIPRTEIFNAFFISLCTMAICGAALMKDEGVLSGWLTLALLFAIIISANVCFDGNPMENNFGGNEATQSSNYGADDEKTQAVSTPIPTEPPQIVSDNQDYGSSDYNNSNTYGNYDSSYNDYEDEETEEDEQEDWEESGYIFPDSDTEYLTKADVKGMSSKEINLAKNELYARHGRIFDREDLQEYFDSCTWYEPLYTRTEWDQKGDGYFFNDVEIKNRNLLVKMEKK